MSFNPYAQHTLANQKTFEQVFNPFQSSVISTRNQSINLDFKSIAWFLYDDDSELKWFKFAIWENNYACLFRK